MKLKKYLLLSLISTVVLSGCSVQENTKVTENTEESSIVGELVAGVTEQVLKDAINNILTPTPSPTPKAEDKIFGIPMFGLEDIVHIRECDNEWELPIHYNSLCEYSTIFDKDYIPEGVTLNIKSYSDEMFITGFTDTEGYIAIPGDMYVGKSVTEEDLKNVFGNIEKDTTGCFTTVIVNSFKDSITIKIELLNDTINSIYVETQPVRSIEQDSMSYKPKKYME